MQQGNPNSYPGAWNTLTIRSLDCPLRRPNKRKEYEQCLALVREGLMIKTDQVNFISLLEIQKEGREDGFVCEIAFGSCLSHEQLKRSLKPKAALLLPINRNPKEKSTSSKMGSLSLISTISLHLPFGYRVASLISRKPLNFISLSSSQTCIQPCSRQLRTRAQFPDFQKQEQLLTKN